MPYGWTVDQIKAAIDRCEREVAEMVARHATPKEIEARRSWLETMRRWIEKEESKLSRFLRGLPRRF